MSLNEKKKNNIKNLLVDTLENKIKAYGRESISMPFLTRLIQDSEKVAAYSFIHSLTTSLGISIYEKVSILIAEGKFDEYKRNYKVGGTISVQQREVIQMIIKEIREGKRKTKIQNEIKEILDAPSANGTPLKSGNIADVFLRKGTEEYYFEIKTAKPNIDVFEKSKEKLLNWVAKRGKNINVHVAIPYNPYHPEKYERFTNSGMMKVGQDLLVGDQYWDLIGGKNTLKDLLEIFEEVGKKFKLQLENKFREISKK